MSLAPTHSPAIHPFAWLEQDAVFLKLAGDLWFASIAFHHSHDQWNRLYATDQDNDRNVKRLKRERQRQQLLRLEVAEQALRDWLKLPGSCGPQPSLDYVDKLVHIIKKRALCSPGDHAVGSSHPATLASAS